MGSTTPLTVAPSSDILRAAPVGLDAEWVEALAWRLAEILREEHRPPAARLVDAATLAAELGVTRSWVYEHRERLGVVRLGTGAKPRLRFDVHTAREALARSASREPHAPKVSVPASSPARRRRRIGGEIDLLPIKGSATPVDGGQERS